MDITIHSDECIVHTQLLKAGLILAIVTYENGLYIARFHEINDDGEFSQESNPNLGIVQDKRLGGVLRNLKDS